MKESPDTGESPSGVVRETRDQHLRLREQAGRLKAMVSTLPDEAGRLRWLGELCLDLSTFIEVILEHFETEEQDGAFEEIVDRRPELLPEIQRLEREHRELTDRMSSVHAIIGEAHVAELSRTLEELIRQFEAHEASENRLLVSAWKIDLGGS